MHLKTDSAGMGVDVFPDGQEDNPGYLSVLQLTYRWL